jgi:CubicO group peptidase (beta-lactamase class C family)
MRILSSFILFSSLVVCSGCSAYAQRSTVGKSNYQLAADYSAEARGLSILVMKGDKIVFEEYQNSHSAKMSHLLASGTKSFSGVMLAAAIDDGLIKSFDEKVSDTISEWKADPQRSKITLRQLLSLTSGIDVGQNLRPPAYSSAVTNTSRYEPGDKFQYGPAPFQIFGEVMRRKLAAKDESVLDYLKRRIFEPIGLKTDRWTLQEGQPNLPSGAFLTAREWIKFGQMLKDGGKWNGKQIIKKSLLDELVKGSKANPNYGITFWLNRSHNGRANVVDTTGRLRNIMGDEDVGTTAISKNGIDKGIANDLYMAAGAANQRLYIIPSLDLVIVRQGRMTKFDDRKFLSLLLTGKEL